MSKIRFFEPGKGWFDVDVIEAGETQNRARFFDRWTTLLSVSRQRYDAVNNPKHTDSARWAEARSHNVLIASAVEDASHSGIMPQVDAEEYFYGQSITQTDVENANLNHKGGTDTLH